MTPASDCGSALIKWVYAGATHRQSWHCPSTRREGQGRQQRDASQRPDFADMALGINLKDLNDLKDGALFIGNPQKAGD